MIPKDVSNVNADYVIIVIDHGEINLNTIKKFEETFMGKELRIAQKTNMVYHCLMNSLSKVGKPKVSMWCSQYKVNGLL